MIFDNSMSNCQTKPLKVLLEYIVDNRGKSVPTSDFGIPLIATNCIKNSELFPTYERIRYVSKEIYDTWFRAHPIPGDIIFVNKGKPGSVAMVPDPIDFCIAQDMMAFRVNKSLVYNKYLFAVLRSSYFQSQIMNYHVGTMIPHFKKGDLDKLLIPVPDMYIQKYIGNLYYKFSYKIETNNKINKTLENMAQEIYKRWFLDFEFPNEEGEPYKTSGGEMVESELGLIPEGWEVISLDKIVDVKSGYSYKSTDLCESNNAMVTIKNFSRNGGYKIDGLKEIIISDRVKQHHYIETNDVVVAHTDLTQGAEIIGNPVMVFSKGKYNKLIMSMDIVKVCPKDKIIENAFLYSLLKTDNFKQYALGYVNGTTVLHLSKKAIPQYKLAFPKKIEICNELGKILKNIMLRISLSIYENDNLEITRDILLPKLMSGEIGIPIEEV